MTAPKIHHPSCQARFGGLCTSCPGDKEPFAVTPGASKVTCPHGIVFWVLGDTLAARERALAEWDDACGCPERGAA